MLTVWGRRNSFNVQKVLWLVGELSLEHTHIDSGGSFGGLDAPEFIAMNPHRKVPVIRDDDAVVDAMLLDFNDKAEDASLLASTFSRNAANCPCGS